MSVRSPATLSAAPGRLRLSGRLDAPGVAHLWAALALPEPVQGAVTIDAAGVSYCDGAGMALLTRLRLLGLEAGCQVRLTGLNDQVRRLVEAVDLPAYAAAPRAPSRSAPLVEHVGRTTVWHAREALAVVAYVGELTLLLARSLSRRGLIRWRDWAGIVRAAGVDALPIVALVGFLLGLILAFQAAVPLRLFGADVYVASMVGVSIIRELGPLMTAIVLTGRSGSAFAAELGAMRVDEEIDALETLGIEPVRFLVVPRVLAGTLVAPLLTVFADLAGLLGGLLVMLALGFPAIVFWNQVRTYVTYPDLLGGLAKAVVFGFLIAAVGCLRGLQAGRDAGAVGRAATRAVVSGIVLIVVTDGLFAVLFYCLRI